MSEASVELEVIRTGDLPIPRAYVFRDEAANPVTRIAGALNPRAERLDSHCLAYVVRHPRAGTFLIDTGFHPDARADRRRDFGWRMSLMFSGLRPADEPFDEQLRAAGAAPADVERVLMTHLHVDHTSGMRLLPNARFTVAMPEWDDATASSAAGRGYVARHLPAEERMDLVDFGAAGMSFGPFAATIDWLGDGSVRLISTPGHTHGHMSVLLRVAELGQVLVVGDAAYTVRSIDEQLVPLLMGGGEDAYRRSLAELKAFADEHPDAIVVPSHDPTAWRALGAPAVEAA